ncbi:MAG: fumarylacetoacetate hydrolase family protein [Muribaculaceae bacterium]|nr:fumarylacetoacetate hydrolase family protein [Muribaculaceae bacterium]
MKLIGIKDNYCLTGAATNDSRLNASIIADSALTRSGKPVFLPDFASQWSLHPTLVLRVGRLGKHIAPRFAHRYINAIAAGFTLQAIDGPKCQLISSIDGAAMVGDFISVSDPDVLNTATISVSDNQGLLGTPFCAANLCLKPLELVATLSNLFTLKMGDLIFCSQAPSQLAPQIGYNISASLNGVENLKIRFR